MPLAPLATPAGTEQKEEMQTRTGRENARLNRTHRPISSRCLRQSALGRRSPWEAVRVRCRERSCSALLRQVVAVSRLVCVLDGYQFAHCPWL